MIDCKNPIIQGYGTPQQHTYCITQGRLPFTGFDAFLMVMAALLILGSGLLIRWFTRGDV